MARAGCGFGHVRASLVTPLELCSRPHGVSRSKGRVLFQSGRELKIRHLTHIANGTPFTLGIAPARNFPNELNSNLQV